MDRNSIISVLEECHGKLNDAFIDIRHENEDGKQFDFVSHPRLSDAVDKLWATISSIDNIVYQSN